MQKRNTSISFIRVIAMMSIIVGHICSWQGIYTYQLGAIGVEIFLFISGYLYGNREILNRKQWILARGKRILIPFWILTVFLSAYVIVTGDRENGMKQLVSSVLNLQGLNYLLPGAGVRMHYIGGIAHCWFVTMIMLCYGLTALLKGSRTEKLIDSHPGIALMLSVSLQMVLALAGIQISYILQFFLGYFYCREEVRLGNKKRSLFIVCTVLTLFLMIVRLLTNRVIDGTALYNNVIARLSFNALGIWLYGAIHWFYISFSAFSEKLTNSRIWKKLDGMSYSVYLVHYMFMMEPFDLKNYFTNDLLRLAAFFPIVTVIAMLLQKVEKDINKLVEKVTTHEKT